MRITRSLPALCLIGLIGAVTSAQERNIFDRDAVVHLSTLSSTGFEAKPDISDDKLTLLFASSQAPGFGSLDLWESTRPSIGAPWGAQVNIAELNGPERDHTPSTSPDGLLIVYSSSRAGGIGSDDAYTSSRATVNDPWAPPTLLPQLSSPDRDMGYTMTADMLTLYYTSNRPGFGGFDLYMSTRPTVNDPWGAPTRVNELSTPWDDKFPSVTGDNLTLYFGSNRPGGVPDMNGNQSLDLWVAMRESVNDPWSEIENVFEVNTEYSEYLMSIANDGSELYFVSDRPSTLGGFDLYSTTAVTGITRYGAATAGEAGDPRMRPLGAPAVGNLGFGYEMTNVTPNAFGVHAVSFAPASGPILVNTSAAAGLNLRLFQTIPSIDAPEVPRLLSTAIPNIPALVGLVIYAQSFMLWDPVGQASIFGLPFSASPALRIVIQP